MPSRSAIVLESVLNLFKPLARLLLRHGVAYPAFVSALKQVFLEAAVAELRETGKKQTDSAISLLSGVHRRDIRTLSRSEAKPAEMKEGPMNMASEVVARWLSESRYLDSGVRPRGVLPRAGEFPSFETLVTTTSRDVRPRAVLDEMVRLGVAQEVGPDVHLLDHGFAPRQGFAEIVALMQDNLHDHIAAASLNLDGHDYLEQALYADELSVQSVEQIRLASVNAWRGALQAVVAEARARYEHDQTHTPVQERCRRMRFGAYFFYEKNRDD